jgi:hypothetical protein
MSAFDDLADPLGPPEGDALGAVLTRVRRRRIVRRGTAALIAVVVVVALGVSANAFAPKTGRVHIEGRGTTVSVPRSTTSVPASTSTSTTTTAAASTTSTTPVSTTSTTPVTTPAVAGEVWSGTQLTITPLSLGRVGVGMTLDQAQIAAGLPFDGRADGASYPTGLPSGFPHLFVGDGANSTVACVGAQIGPNTVSPQTVTTPEGFHLGDTVQRLRAIYGGARYSPAPTGGISPRAGYVVSEASGNLAFSVDSTGTRVLGITGGGHDLTPSSCTG